MIKLNYKFLISLLAILFFVAISCSDRNDESTEEGMKGIYRVEITYSGDSQNWSEALNVNVKINTGITPSLTGITIQKTEKNDNTEFTFYLPAQMTQNKSFETSNNIRQIRITGKVTPVKASVDALTVNVKIFKDQMIKDNFSFRFDQNSAFTYYIINAE